MRILAALSLILLTTAAQAKPVILTLDDQEQAQLMQILDAATRQGGLNAATATVHLLQRLQAAPVLTGERATPEPAKPAADQEHKP